MLATYAYDTLGRLTQTRDGTPGTPIETYACDATGNRTGLTTAAGVADYTYPATGNRTSLITAAGTSTYSYPADSHHLVAVGGEARGHDAAGNTISIGGKTFTYNDANRMSAVKLGGAVAERYGYNHRGERVLRASEGGDTQITVYDEAGQWLGNYSATGQAQQQAIWLDNYPVALINVPAAGVPELAYIQPDHLGTPRVVIDPARDVAIWEWSNKSEVFGDQAPANDPDGDGVAFELALRFPGQQATDATGMFYNYQREYDPAVGRYSQSDPIGLEGGFSLYSYVNADPVSLIDPDGLQMRAPSGFNRHGGGNSAQRRIAGRAQRNAIGSNSHSTPVYTRGLSPEEVGSLENAASLLGEHDYTQYCVVEICRQAEGQCTAGDVMAPAFPNGSTVSQVNARGCRYVSARYSDTPPPVLARPQYEALDIISVIGDLLMNWRSRR